MAIKGKLQCNSNENKLDLIFYLNADYDALSRFLLLVYFNEDIYTKKFNVPSSGHLYFFDLLLFLFFIFICLVDNSHRE